MTEGLITMAYLVSGIFFVLSLGGYPNKRLQGGEIFMVLLG